MNKVGLALICFFLGGLGILYLCTAGLFGIGALVDFIMILCGKFTRKDGSLVDK